MSSLLSNVSGEVRKLIFTGYKTDKFKEEEEKGSFTVQYNPSEFNTSYAVERESKTIEGVADNESGFKSLKMSDVSFDFVIDATGASPSSFTNFVNDIDIAKKVEDFLKVCYVYDGDSHQPHYVTILYGKLFFKTVFVSCDIKYTLFKNDGTPLRAKISAKFKTTVSTKLLEKMWSPNSPDLTHKRIVKDKDTLIAMSEKIYERNDLYQEVARFNNLNTFRKVKTGSELYFPPLKK